MRVGRAAIDEEAIRLIEEHNPDVHFDWTRILKSPAPVEAQRQPAPPKQDQRPRRDAVVGREEEPEPIRDVAVNLDVPTVAAAEPADPATTEVIAALESEDEPAPAEEPRASVAEARLGSEGLLRLRARYAEIMARISERELDDSTREELKALAERLNPDAWVTEEEVHAGLDSYESVLATLRPLVGTPRRRRRGTRS